MNHQTGRHNQSYAGTDRRQGQIDRRRPSKKPNYAMRRAIAATALVALGAGVKEAYDQATDTRAVMVKHPGAVSWGGRSELADEFRQQGATVVDIRQVQLPSRQGQEVVGYVMKDVNDGLLGDLIDGAFPEDVVPVD